MDFDSKQTFPADVKRLVQFQLAEFAKLDEEPFEFFSSLSSNLTDEIFEVIQSSKKHRDSISRKKLKAKAIKRKLDGSEESSSSAVNSSSAERIIQELEEKAFKRGKTKAGSRKRLRWTDEEDRMLAEMYLKHQDHKLPFVTVSSYFEDRSNTDCCSRFKSISRTHKLHGYSHEQIAHFILKE